MTCIWCAPNLSTEINTDLTVSQHTGSMSTSNELSVEWRVSEELVEHVVDVDCDQFIDDVHVKVFMSFALHNLAAVVWCRRLFELFRPRQQ